VYGWRVFIAVSAIPVGVNVILFLFLTESPRWLLSRGRVRTRVSATHGAVSTLGRIRWTTPWPRCG
jgi:hypothetical protein